MIGLPGGVGDRALHPLTRRLEALPYGPGETRAPLSSPRSHPSSAQKMIAKVMATSPWPTFLPSV